MPLNTLETAELVIPDASRVPRRDHPIYHPHIRGFETPVAQMKPGAEYAGYSGLDVDDAEENRTERLGTKTLQQQREDFQEMLRGWAGL